MDLALAGNAAPLLYFSQCPLKTRTHFFGLQVMCPQFACMLCTQLL